MLMPMMLGMLVTSVSAAASSAAIGRYKLFPDHRHRQMTFGLGAAVAARGRRHVVGRPPSIALWLGLGMGMVMQVLVVAVQNSRRLRASRRRHLRARCCSARRRRARGVALFGAIFANGCMRELAGPGMEFLCRGHPGGGAGPAAEPAPGIRQPRSWRRLRPVFVVAAAIARVGFALTWLLRESPLREAAGPKAWARASRCRATPPRWKSWSASSPSLIARENRWRVYADLARRAAIDLPAPELWMLARLGEREPMTIRSLAAELKIPQQALEAPLDALCDRGIAEKAATGQLQLTPTGVAMRDRAVAARRQGLADMLARWQPEEHPDVLALIERMAQALTSDLPAPQAA